MKWEYRTMELLEGFSVLGLLNECREKGWEFVWCDLDKNVFIFKRPIPDKLTEEEMERLFQQGDVFDEKTRKGIEGYFGGKVG